MLMLLYQQICNCNYVENNYVRNICTTKATHSIKNKLSQTRPNFI